MQLTITTLDDQIMNFDVSDDLELENLKAQCEFELGVPSAHIVLMWNGRPLNDGKKSLKDYGIANGDVLLLQQMRGQTQGQEPAQNVNPGAPRIDFGSIMLPGSSRSPQQQQQRQPQRPQQRDLEDPAVILELIVNNPHERALLKERNPPLSDALESGNKEKFIEVYTRQRNERLNKEREQIRLLQMDPLNPEAQKLIAEEIRLKNVEHNMESAIEYVPESFGQVVMLYIDCKVNGHHVKAFVDSGAQMTIMSQTCAERCNIMRLVDTRWAGIAKGVGTQTIIGRVHLGQIQIGNDFLQSSFSILENQPMDMLLGLDMLKRHQCVIDLQSNQLKIGTTGAQTRFLSESELPAHARINQPNSPEAMDEDQALAKALQKSAEEAAGSISTSTTESKITFPSPVLSGNGAASNISTNIPGVSASANSQSSAASGFPESVIRSLVEKGYQRHNVIQALHEAEGDEAKAAMNLFVKSLKK